MKNRWVPITAYIKPSDAFTRNGEVKIWVDGELVLERNDVSTCARQDHKLFQWGIGNYGGKEEQGYILMKDVIVSDTRPF